MSARMAVHALHCLRREFYQRSGLLLVSSRRNFASCLQPWTKVDSYGLLDTNVDMFKTTLTRNIINAKVVRYDIPQPVTTNHKVTGAQEDDRGGMLMVYWNDGSASRYPYVWLRDNCKCPRCFQGKSNRRILHMRNVDVDVKPTDVQVCCIPRIIYTDYRCGVRWTTRHIHSVNLQIMKTFSWQF